MSIMSNPLYIVVKWVAATRGIFKNINNFYVKIEGIVSSAFFD